MTNEAYVQKKKSLCILVDCFLIGGVERVLLDALDEISEKFDVTLYIYTSVVDKSMLKKIPDNVNVVIGNHALSKYVLFFLSLPVLGQIIIRSKIKKHYDYLIVAKPHFLMASASHLADKTFYWDHNGKDAMYADGKNLSVLRKFNKQRIRYGIKKYDSVWFLTDEIKEKTDKAFGLKNSKVLPNPVDCKAITEKSLEKADDLVITRDFNIVMVGRLSSEKGFSRVISALSNIDSRTDWHLYIIGNGTEKNKLLELCDKGGKQDRITFLGEKDNPYKYMKNMQLLVCPSYAESFGLVMVEALLLSVPVLATDTQGSRYVLKNGHYGTIVNNDDKSIKEALVQIFNNQQLIKAVDDETHNWILSHDKSKFGEKISLYLS